MLLARCEQLEREVEVLKAENKVLKFELAAKDEEIRKLKIKVTSKNSSMPPSTDTYKPSKNTSLREKSGKKSGGQLGHEGHSLPFVQTPDKEINLYPKQCKSCGGSLSEQDGLLISTRQVIDLPVVEPIYIHYNQYQISCSCGCVNASEYEKEVSAPNQYSKRTRELIVYLNIRQYIPINRIKEYMRSIYGINMSEGTICNMLKKEAEIVQPIYDSIKNELENAKCLGVDETSYSRKNDSKGWFWVWQNPLNTFIKASTNRANATAKEQFPDGFSKSVLVSDCYASNLSTKALDHQYCLTHILREFNHCQQLYPASSLSKRWKDIIKESMDLKKKMHEMKSEKYKEACLAIEYKYADLIDLSIESPHAKLIKLGKRFAKNIDGLTTFLFYKDVPPDNNGSERSIRNVKVKTKISGYFTTVKTAQTFAILRSVTDTAIKRFNNPFYYKHFEALLGTE